jgi:hypothetical protein
VYYWLAEHPDFAHRYAIARACLIDDMADEIIEIADDKSRDVPDRALRCAKREWWLSKMHPRKYGAGGMASLVVEAPRTRDDAREIKPQRPVNLEQDPLYPAYLAWGRALADAKK